MDVLKVLDEFARYKLGRNCRQSSVKNYVGNLKYFFTYVNKNPQDITLEDIEDYIIHLKVDKKNSINTQKIKQSAIRYFFAWHSVKYHYDNPAVDLPALPEEVKVPVMPTPDEFTRMVYSCDQSTFLGRRDAALLCLMADTGIRRSECSALNVYNVELHRNHYMLIVPKIKSRERAVPFGKLSAGAMVGEMFTAYMQEIKYVLNYKPDDPLFKQNGIRFKDGRLGPQGVNFIIKKCAKRAGIERPIVAHSMRHFFGTYSIINGMDIRTLKKLMGHAWLETTERYVHVAEMIEADSLDFRATTKMKAPEQHQGFIKILKDTQTRG